MAVGVALHRDAVDGRPARVAEAEVAGHLVERLAGGVVDGRAEQAVAAVALHRDEHRVAARHEQHDERQLECRGPRGSAAYRWASRWLTATNGTSHTSASALAVLTPTSSAPTRPGP